MPLPAGRLAGSMALQGLAVVGSGAVADLRAFLGRIPKVELHCHLLGTVRKATMKAIAARNGARTTEERIEGFYIRGEKPVGVLAIFREMEAHILKTPADFRRIAYEYLEDAAAHSVRYAELYWNPTGSLRHTGLCYGALQAAILAGMAEAERDFGIRSNLIPSIDREAPPGDAVGMVRLMAANRDPRAPGIGIDYRETGNPPEKFAEAYALARAAGLRRTAHAGEFGEPWTNVAAALDLLGVERLDHAYTILDNPALTARCAAEGTVITVVPTNSYYLRTLDRAEWAAKHPIRRMGRAGLRIHPNTDDPAFHRTDPTRCWESMVVDFGYTLADLRGFMLNGLDGAWIDDGLRAAWKREWSAEFDRLAAEHGHAAGPPG